MYPNNEKQIVTEPVNTATGAPDSGTIPFFCPEPLPGETQEKTVQRLQFITAAASAIADTATKITTSIQEQVMLFVQQSSLFAEMKLERDRSNFEETIWEMFEALMRDEATAPSFDIRADACYIFRWLQKVTNSIYPVQAL